MKVGDLVQHKLIKGVYGTVIDWEEDYHHTIVFVVMFPTHQHMDGNYPEDELELICK